MKTRIKILFIAFIMHSGLAYGQLDNFDSLIAPALTKPQVSGFMWFQTPNNLPVGDCFNYYKTIENDIDNDMTLIKQWTDPQLNMTHYKYQQTYKGVPVEIAGCIEHYQGSDLIFTNAKHAINLNMDVSPKIDEATALSNLLSTFPSETIFAWEDAGWENDAQVTTNDPNATWFPVGELELAIDDYTDLDFNIDGSRYTLAYKFTIMAINPQNISTYWVDATTGQVIKEYSEYRNDGPATVQGPGTGVGTIDTRERGFPNNDWVLETDNGVIAIHTKKYHAFWDWIVRGEIDDNDDNWVGYEILATTAHYYVEKVWEYYRDVHGLDGMDDNNANIRVHIERDDASGHNARYFNTFLADNLEFNLFAGLSSGSQYDIVAHEFTHGVINYSSNLVYQDESGALNESFCDIMGQMAERDLFLTSGSGNWVFGSPSLWTRSLFDPNNDGEHYAEDLLGTCNDFFGQPHTYDGLFWEDPNLNDCDFGNVHGNSGVQNYWFYLLSDGGTGTNDLGDDYTINGIGPDDAVSIAYWNMVNVLQSGSQFTDAREGAIASAILLFGDCTNQHYQTTNAWYAVGVGLESDCDEVLSFDKPTEFDGISIFPNPNRGEVTLEWTNVENFDVKIFSLEGKLLFEKLNHNNNQILELPFSASGVYILEMKNGENKIRKRIIRE